MSTDDVGRVKEARGPGMDVKVELVRRLGECQSLVMEVLAGDTGEWDPVGLLAIQRRLAEDAGALEMGLSPRQRLALLAEGGDRAADAALRARR